MKMRGSIFLRYWLPVLIWLGFIFIGSTDLMSAQHTSRFLIPFILWLKPDISPEMLEQIHFLWRKSGHVFEYTVLAILMIRALRGGTQLRPALSMFAIAWIGSTICAALDEFHQSFVASRGAAYGDVLIDSAGAVFGLLIWCWWMRREAASKL